MNKLNWKDIKCENDGKMCHVCNQKDNCLLCSENKLGMGRGQDE